MYYLVFAWKYDSSYKKEVHFDILRYTTFRFANFAHNVHILHWYDWTESSLISDGTYFQSAYFQFPNVCVVLRSYSYMKLFVNISDWSGLESRVPSHLSPLS